MTLHPRIYSALLCAVILSSQGFAMGDWAPDWTCEPAQWTSGPGVSGGKFEGTLESHCTFLENKGGTLLQLENALVDSTIKDATTVHEGPVNVTHQGQSAVFLDVSVTEDSKDFKGVIRADTYFVTTNDSLAVSSKSTDIQNNGGLAQVESIQQNVGVAPSATAGEYNLTLSRAVVIRKPAFVPASLFLKKAKEGLNEDMLEWQKAAIEEMRETL